MHGAWGLLFTPSVKGRFIHALTTYLITIVTNLPHKRGSHRVTPLLYFLYTP
jgi:hypothetical protein